jgi:hypothetical protein
MNLLLAILHLNTPNGAASYVVTVASYLQRLGHEVTVYTTDAGTVAATARAQGLRVVDEEYHLPASLDGLLTNDTVIAYQMAARYPTTPHVYVAHGAEMDIALPPQMQGAISAVTVMNERVRRHIQAMSLDVRTIRLSQPIDVERFTARSPAPAHPRRALLLGNYLRGPKLKLVTDACERAGLEWIQVGRDNGARADPEIAIADADIVIAYGRSALEAMASGRAAFVMDQYAGDGWVTAERHARLEADGFRGTAFPGVFDGHRIEEALRGYHADMGPVNRDLVLQHHNPYAHADELATLFKRLSPGSRSNGTPSAEMARLIRTQWHSDWTVLQFSREIEGLRDRLDHSEARAVAAEARADHAEGTLAFLKSTRRYRFGAMLARPLDRLRQLRRARQREGAERSA